MNELSLVTGEWRHGCVNDKLYDQVDILQQVLIRMLVKRYKKSGMSRKMQRMVIAVVGDEVMTLPATGIVLFDLA